MRYAYVVESIVRELLPVGAEPASYHPDYVTNLHEVDAAVSEGWTFADGVFSPPPPPPKPQLSAIKEALTVAIDEAAERERSRYVTAGSGQAMTYQAKSAEALALAADPAPDPSAYPLLSAEIGITAPDLAGVGAVVRAAYAAWQIIGAGIERARLAGKAAVQAASDEAEARAAAAVEWPEH